jgi:S1-C subfamily serine protease
MVNRKILLPLGTVIILSAATIIYQIFIATHQSDHDPQELYPKTAVTQTSTDLSIRLQAITVKILAGSDGIGSGTMWRSHNGNNQVITNSHVLVAQQRPLFIQTADGQVHAAQVVTPAGWENLDLVALQFKSQKKYLTANTDRSSQLQVRAVVLAAGFPLNSQSTSLAIEKGAITHILKKPLAEGYQLGYDSIINKGMSGGPLVDEQGTLVGINGLYGMLPKPLPMVPWCESHYYRKSVRLVGQYRFLAWINLGRRNSDRHASFRTSNI